MRELKRPDKVAYIPFASVYRSFEDDDEFAEVSRKCGPPAAPSSASAPSRMPI